MSVTTATFVALKVWKSNVKWFVVSPTKNSTVQDICFNANPYELTCQLIGGLDPNQILVTFDKEDDAKAYAKRIIDAVNSETNHE
jgi:hypothetical protein